MARASQGPGPSDSQFQPCHRSSPPRYQKSPKGCCRRSTPGAPKSADGLGSAALWKTQGTANTLPPEDNEKHRNVTCWIFHHPDLGPHLPATSSNQYSKSHFNHTVSITSPNQQQPASTLHINHSQPPPISSDHPWSSKVTTLPVRAKHPVHGQSAAAGALHGVHVDVAPQVGAGGGEEPYCGTSLWLAPRSVKDY